MSEKTEDEGVSLPDPLRVHALFTHPLFMSLVANHPNDLKLSPLSSNDLIPDGWRDWWEWAGESKRPAWLAVLHTYAEKAIDEHDIPNSLRDILLEVKQTELDRTPCSIPKPASLLRGMSPKKSHEVIRMSEHVKGLLKRPELQGVKHIVDVGAGQGYLSRALYEAGLHVLALDGDDGQTEGAERRIQAMASQSKSKRRDAAPRETPVTGGSITHKTAHLTPETLQETVTSWVSELGTNEQPVSIMFVALHACGSLTPDIFRVFVSQNAASRTSKLSWVPAGACVVGCCYNLMSSAGDFPLSNTYAHLPRLTETQLQLAAQMPARWLDTPSSRSAAELALRKIVFRALLSASIKSTPSDIAPSSGDVSGAGPVFDASTKSAKSSVYRPRGNPVNSRTGDDSANGAAGTDDAIGTGSDATHRRLGKLPSDAYTSFENFLKCAGERLGAPIEMPQGDDEWFARAQSRIETLHTLRCIMGPSIESAIVADRVAWLRETLVAPQREAHVELVSLFDQAAGSARNFGIVIY